MNATASLTTLGWRVIPRLPRWLASGLFTVVADGAWLTHGKGVRQLERNLARVCPERTERQIRQLSRAGMRSYMRYYRQVFQQSRWTREQIHAMVRVEEDDELRSILKSGQSGVVTLGHLGNWDLAGVWAGTHLAPVTTVAERLKPEEVYQEFLRARTSAGITIIPLDGSGTAVFRELLRAAKGRQQKLIPILADRDLGASGVEVTLFDQPARLAPGPAALAEATGLPLIPATLHYERLHGERRRAARSAWGIVVRFAPRVPIPNLPTRRERVAAMTQTWGDAVAAGIKQHPQDWHMLQKVFVADLDPDRDAQRFDDQDERS